MAVKIVIDAGHGGYDAGATYNGRKEKDDVLALALAVGEILKAQGYDVVYTRTSDVYDSPVQKARIANESGADFFVSLHRNSSPTPNQYNGVQTLVYNNSGLKAVMAENINKELEDVGYRNINVAERPDLAVLRRTKMPAVLVEAGFINSDTDNTLFDTRFSETAEAIAKGIDETLRDAGYTVSNTDSTVRMVNGVYGFEQSVPAFATQSVGSDKIIEKETISQNKAAWNNDKANVDDVLKHTGQGMINKQADSDMGIENKQEKNEARETQYQILVGIYRTFGAASNRANRFINAGYDAEVVEDAGLYQVRIGSFADVEDALIAQRELRDRGYDTLIVRKETF